MRELNVKIITDTISKMCQEANFYLPNDIRMALDEAREREQVPLASSVISDIIQNYKIAESERMPICQDTGLACVFMEIGQDVHFAGGSLNDAINEGVRRGYEEGYLRKSVVRDPIDRVNTKDNTPAMIYYSITEGDRVKITFAPKGGGSENMSRIKMLKPADGIDGVKEFVLETVKLAGSNPCPPIVLGIGIGGNFDKVAYLAKKALLRPIDTKNEMQMYATLEEELLQEINALGIGPQGYGGVTTALGVNIEVMPTHIAQLPGAVNVGCHVTREMTALV